MSDRVAAYRPLVSSIAIKLAGSQRAKQVGAEFDDLEQMGLIAVWKALESGVAVVGEDHIRDRMRNYMRWLGASTRQPISIEELLPFDDAIAQA